MLLYGVCQQTSSPEAQHSISKAKSLLQRTSCAHLSLLPSPSLKCPGAAPHIRSPTRHTAHSVACTSWSAGQAASGFLRQILPPQWPGWSLLNRPRSQTLGCQGTPQWSAPTSWLHHCWVLGSVMLTQRSGFQLQPLHPSSFPTPRGPHSVTNVAPPLPCSPTLGHVRPSRPAGPGVHPLSAPQAPFFCRFWPKTRERVSQLSLVSQRVSQLSILSPQKAHPQSDRFSQCLRPLSPV